MPLPEGSELATDEALGEMTEQFNAKLVKETQNQCSLLPILVKPY